MKKLLIVGIDGADWGYLNYGIKKGKLPTIKSLMQKGSYGKLKSVIPPVTLVSWLCFSSGQNPGKVGHFGYIKKLKNSYDFDVKIRDVFSKITPFWKRLNEKGIKVGIVNIPYTFPPQKTDKFMVCIAESFHIPKGKNSCYPKQLESEIIKNLGEREYNTTYNYFNKPVDERLQDSIVYLKNKAKLSEFLLKRYSRKIQCFMTVFFPDQLHHFLTDKEKTMEYYKQLDKEIKKFIRIYKPDNILLLSDHGEGPVKKEFYVNEFLMKNNLLKLKKKKKFLNKIGVTLENLQRLSSIFKLDAKLVKILPRSFIETYIRPNIPSKKIRIKDVKIDWAKTIAFSFNNSSGGIYINLKGREPEGIVEKKDYEKTAKQIINKLKNLKDPKTNKKLKVEAYMKEEIYKGKYIEDSPDIVYAIEDWDYIPKTALPGNVFKQPRDPGNHKLYGIFIMAGKNIKKGKVEDAELIDISPTILKLFDVEKTKDVDGKVLDIFK